MYLPSHSQPDISQTQSPPQSTHTSPRDTVIHYHVTLQNCDGINIRLSDNDNSGLSPRGLHFDQGGALRRLSWKERGPQRALPVRKETPLAVEDSQSVHSRSQSGSCTAALSSAASSKSLRVGSAISVPIPSVSSNQQHLSESPPNKTAKIVSGKGRKSDVKNITLQKSTSKSTPELRTPDVSTVPKTTNPDLVKGKGKYKRRRRRPKGDSMDTETTTDHSGNGGDRTKRLSPARTSTPTSMDISSCPHTQPPTTHTAGSHTRSQSDHSLSSVLSNVDPVQTDTRTSSVQPLANTSSSSSDSSNRPFPWHSTREATTPPAIGGHRRLARPVPTATTISCVQLPPIAASPPQVTMAPTLSTAGSLTTAPMSRSAPISSAFTPVARLPAVVAVTKPTTSKPSTTGSTSSDKGSTVTNGSIFAISDGESSGSGSSRPVAKVTPLPRPQVTESEADSPRSREELQILQLENQRSALMLQLEQEQERTALLDNLQRQQEEFEEEIAHREAEFIREEAERRSRRHRRESGSQGREDRAERNRSTDRAVEFPLDTSRGRSSRSRERRARVEITVEAREESPPSCLPPQVEAEVAAMEEAFRREVAERRSRRYRRHQRDGPDGGSPVHGGERRSRRDHGGETGTQGEGNRNRALSGQRRARFDEENLTR